MRPMMGAESCRLLAVPHAFEIVHHDLVAETVNAGLIDGVIGVGGEAHFRNVFEVVAVMGEVDLLAVDAHGDGVGGDDLRAAIGGEFDGLVLVPG